MPSSWLVLAWTQVWQVTLLAAFVLLLTWWLGRRRPRLSHLLCLVVVAKCLVPPVLSSPLSPYSWMVRSLASDSIDARPASPDSSRSPGAPDEPGAAASSRAVTSAARVARTWDLGAILFTAWACGATALLVVLAFRWSMVRRILRRRVDADTAALEERVAPLCRRTRVRPVELVVVDAETTPFVTGVVRPRIVLPSSLLEALPLDAVEAVLAHELAHVRRWDVLAGHVQVVVQVVYWFHPLVWFLQLRSRQLREWCCDESVVHDFGLSKKTYAHSLVEVAAHGAPAPAAVPGMSVFDFTAGRIRRLLELPERSSNAVRRWDPVLAVLLALVVLPGAAVPRPGLERERPTAEAAPRPEPADLPLQPDADGPVLSTVRRELQFVPVDGFVGDADHDGVFESLDAVGDDLRVTADDSPVLPHEVAMLEFDLAELPPEGTVESVRFEVAAWLIQGDGRIASLALRAELYEGNGRIETADATRPATAAVSIPVDRTRGPGPVTFEIDVARLPDLLARSPHVGIRLGLDRGSRVILVARENGYRTGAATLTVDVLVPETNAEPPTRSIPSPPTGSGDDS